MIVAFDVDGCLIDDEDQPRWPVIDILRAFHAMGWDIWVWSGGGKDYAEHVVRRLGISSFVSGTYNKLIDRPERKPDLTFDDMTVALGYTNVRLPLRPVRY